MARPTLGESESLRLQMVITADELEEIDRWRRKHQVSSRSQAIRDLCCIAILAERWAELYDTKPRGLFEIPDA